MGYTMRISAVLPYIDVMLKGLTLSITLTCLSAVAGAFIGLGSAVVRLSKKGLFRWVVDAYVEVLRNTPLLVQLYVIYFGLAQFNIHVPPTIAAIIGMTINMGAYTTVIFEAGIKAIDTGQSEAAYTLGLTPYQSFVYVVLPQAFRIVLPSLTNQAISLFLFSSVAATISVPELTGQALYVEAMTLRTFEVFLVATLLYFVFTFTLSLFTSYYERTRAISS